MSVAVAYRDYRRLFTAARAIQGTPKRHANVLEHTLGYFSGALSPGERREIVDLITDYRHRLVPLIVPITLIRHFANKYRIESPKPGLFRASPPELMRAITCKRKIQPMKTFNFDTQIWLPKTPDEIFPFFAEPRNLDVLTPRWLRFQILTPAPIEMKVGTLLDYRLRLYGVPIRWQSEITLWQPPHRFADQQSKGPYQYWHHTHIFRAYERGTVVEDHVLYAAPGGSLVRRLLVAPDLQRIFSYRHDVLRMLFDPKNAAP
jgi:ligand-binding SRPBCC domain-containing protein